jgi:hypothetical protein
MQLHESGLLTNTFEISPRCAQPKRSAIASPATSPGQARLHAHKKVRGGAGAYSLKQEPRGASASPTRLNFNHGGGQAQWTAEEDELLLSTVMKFGLEEWESVSQDSFPDGRRSPGECRERWQLIHPGHVKVGGPSPPLLFVVWQACRGLTLVVGLCVVVAGPVDTERGLLAVRTGGDTR